MLNKHMKRNWTSNVIRKLQIKQIDTTKRLLQWVKFKTLWIPNIDEDVKLQESLLIADGNGKWYAYFGRQAVFSQN